MGCLKRPYITVQEKGLIFFLNLTTSCGSHCYFWTSLFGLSVIELRFVFSVALSHWPENAAPWGHWTEQEQSFPGGDGHLCASQSVQFLTLTRTEPGVRPLLCPRPGCPHPS